MLGRAASQLLQRHHRFDDDYDDDDGWTARKIVTPSPSFHLDPTRLVAATNANKRCVRSIAAAVAAGRLANALLMMLAFFSQYWLPCRPSSSVVGCGDGWREKVVRFP